MPTATCSATKKGATRQPRVLRHDHKVLTTAKARRARAEGRDKLVAPVVMLTRTVIACATCPTPELTNPDDFARAPADWNGHPVTFDHPMSGANHYLSAHDSRAVGFVIGDIRNAGRKGDHLVGEAWIDVERALQRGAKEVIERIEAGEPVEISPGFYADTRIEAGEFNGKTYGAVEYNTVPDHLAMLPKTAKGACSWADGCGVRAATEAVLTALAAGDLPSESMAAGIDAAELEDICHKRKTEWSNGNPVTEGQRLAACAAMKAATEKDACCAACTVRDFVTSLVGESTHPDLDHALQAALVEQNPDAEYCFVIASEAPAVTFAKDGEQFKQEFEATEDNTVTLKGVAVRVRSIHDFVRVAMEAKMNKQQLIDRIVTGRKLEGDEEKKFRVALEPLGEDTLTVLANGNPFAMTDEEKKKKEEEDAAAAAKAKAATEAKVAEAKPELSPETIEFLTARMEEMSTGYVERIKAATKVYSDDDLAAMPFRLLEKTAKAIAPVKNAAEADFSGRGGPRTPAPGDDADPIGDEVKNYDERVRVLREGRKGGKAA